MPIIVGIDGFHGTRKSNLAYKLGHELRANVVSVDDYIQPNCGSFSSNFVDCVRLSHRISNLKSVGSVVLEGVCLLEIIEKAGIAHDCLIHTQMLNLAKSWIYASIFDDTEQYQRYLANSRGLEAEVLKYHAKYRPWEKANFIFRVEV